MKVRSNVCRDCTVRTIWNPRWRFSDVLILYSVAAMMAVDCHKLDVYNPTLHASIGDSVTFRSSYSISSSLHNWPSIEWSFGNQTILYYSMYNGSLNSKGGIKWCTGRMLISPLYKRRLEFHPTNASLTVRDLQYCDEGTYQITFLSFETIIRKKIQLRVRSAPESEAGLLLVSLTTEADGLQHPEEQAGQSSAITYLVLICVFVSVLFSCFILYKCILPLDSGKMAPKSLLKQGLWHLQRSNR
ncbi:hypothetical protein XENTR_v10020161 [Xenopus tropicalis]|uniref:Uncharacterized protein LOC100491408 n=1 Tax=Xenopus tropicalis TaxID=8364 RepID=A0A1B8Y7Q9_XENTR|nr:uncharacterized protein LOC100491408 [Xenopus tropicalis]KAE8582546.1 hypothetical protein XENTR_v10020161 [Xenopus tropicalis]|eukprot:XP_002941138.2 PREDICTED: uncharacterized protein LOC100491408 [Xenopus tropicalis]